MAFVLLTLLALASTAAGKTVTGSFRSKDDNYHLDWTVDQSAGVMEMTMAAQTTGWVGVSWGAGCHWRSDAVVGWVRSSGAVTLMDMWTDEEEDPPEDSQDDVTLVSASQEGGWTTLTFSRPLVTGDGSRDVDIKDENLALGWAFGSSDGSGDEFEEHEDDAYGVVRANLWAGEVYDHFMAPGAMVTVAAFALMLGPWALGRWLARRREQVHPVGSPSGPKAPPRLAWLRARLPVPWTNYSVSFSSGALLFAGAQCVLLGVSVASRSWTLGHALGQLTAANALLTVLPATRTGIIVRLLGVPFERALVAHRLLGTLTLVVVSGHAIYFLVDFANHSELGRALQEHNTYGTLGWAAILAIGATSLPYVRRHYFQVFMYSHYLFYGFGFAGLLHHKACVPYVLVAGGFYWVDLAFRWHSRYNPDLTQARVSSTGDVVALRFPKRAGASYPLGSYVFVARRANFSDFAGYALGLLEREWHPFSVASGVDDAEVEVHVKALGDETQRLIQAAKDGALRVAVEGPYGQLPHDVSAYPAVILVGGGIGLTPLLSVARSVTGPPVFLVWAVRTPEEHRDWAPALAALPANVQLTVFVTRGEADPEAGVRAGRPDVPAVFKEITGSAAAAKVSSYAVCACGPRALTDAVWKECTRQERSERRRMDLSIEVFDF